MIDSNVVMVGLGAQNPETDRGDQDMPTIKDNINNE